MKKIKKYLGIITILIFILWLPRINTLYLFNNNDFYFKESIENHFYNWIFWSFLIELLILFCALLIIFRNQKQLIKRMIFALGFSMFFTIISFIFVNDLAKNFTLLINRKLDKNIIEKKYIIYVNSKQISDIQFEYCKSLKVNRVFYDFDKLNIDKIKSKDTLILLIGKGYYGIEHFKIKDDSMIKK